MAVPCMGESDILAPHEACWKRPWKVTPLRPDAGVTNWGRTEDHMVDEIGISCAQAAGPQTPQSTSGPQLRKGRRHGVTGPNVGPRAGTA